MQWMSSYLGSLIASSGRMDVDVDRRVAQASKAFGALRKAVFLDKNLSLTTKRKLYNACVLSPLPDLLSCRLFIPPSPSHFTHGDTLGPLLPVGDVQNGPDTSVVESVQFPCMLSERYPALCARTD